MIRRWAAGGVVALAVLPLAISGCCKRKTNNTGNDPPYTPPPVETRPPEPTASKVKFNRVPLQVSIPAGWNQTQNTAAWLVYRPDEGGALVAMSGEKSCDLVVDRFAGALRELGLTNVVWKSPQHTYINGQRAKVAEGTAIEANQLSYVKYSLTYAAGNQGCLITLYNVWQSKAGNFRAVADQIIMSVEPQ
jgi:uncharacterized iron-regulated membrane protein